jgi:uncharacterized membrane protein
MTIMSRRKLIKQFDVDKIREAIAAAEKKTSGEIRVSVAPYFWGPVRPVAERAFRRLGMEKTEQRNGVLFFIVPARRRFVILGDEGIHAKVGQDFWDKIAAAMAGRFHEGDFSAGLIGGIEAATDVNELPDDIDFGGKK